MILNLIKYETLFIFEEKLNETFIPIWKLTFSFACEL